MESKEKQIRNRVNKENALAKLEEENHQIQKRNDAIKKSPIWKIGNRILKPFVPFQYLFNRLWPKSKKTMLMDLEQEHYNLKCQINKLISELHVKETQIQLLANNQNSEEDLKRAIKLLSREPASLEIIDAIVNGCKLNSESSKRILDTIVNRFYLLKDTEQRNVVFNKLVDVYDIREIPEKIIRYAEETSANEINPVASFKTNLALRSTIRKKQLLTHDHILDDKSLAYQLMDILDIRRPGRSTETFTSKKISSESGQVLKPVNSAGSRGVYIIYDETKILKVKDASLFQGYDELKLRMIEDVQKGFVQNDEWFLEELIYDREKQGPARDLKFYCFYGRVGLVLEIERYPNIKYCWWNRSGYRIHTGKYENQLFEGEGFTKGELELVEKLSAELPVPFMRIDFLKTSKEFVFGEFTPKPGNYDEFNQKTDQSLGEMYLEAEYKLIDDLINGKKFSCFKEIYRKVAIQKNDSKEEDM
ncbi:hypothetical protein HXA35_18345 [Bacillus sp. A301a_S52]|nr:hypothetical protein [Bacillus sp. A301a_S52]